MLTYDDLCLIQYTRVCQPYKDLNDHTKSILYDCISSNFVVSQTLSCFTDILGLNQQCLTAGGAMFVCLHF